ncbi:MAG: restriction endonuclease subunit S [Pseudomonas sp.]|uniref:restriction endonuclease subunit S n=1 Tax=Pseudomonas sp. TaxID=306 RepID=UPI003BB63600
MTALLTDNLPLLAGALNGIKKLRELILELAVRGKLVEQDASDEPASELLKRIAAEKKRLVAEGKIKKQKPLAVIAEEEKPFELPAGWEWTHLGELGLVGSSSRVHQKDWQTSGVPFYRAREIVRLSKDGFVENELFISEELYQEFSAGGSAPKVGDIMLTGVGTIGVPYRVQEVDRFYFKDASVLIFKKYVGDNSGYLLKYFVSPLWINTIHAESMGTTVHTLTIARANETLCPLPPLAEQHRIATKVDELMALCDRLEAQQADAASAHAQLVQALLGSLTQASAATEFAANWQRLAEHFHTLFSTEPSIDALKQALLQLALMGKLVTQDPSDEPASELLKHIDEARVSSVSGGRKRKQIDQPLIDDNEKDFELPNGWDWVRLQRIISVSSGDGLVSADMSPAGGVPVYGGNGVTGYHDKQNIEKETLVIGRVGYYCGSIHLTPTNAWITDNALIVSFSEENLYKSFLFWLLKGTNLKEQENATAQPVISGRKIYSIVLAIPPLAEQHRIVAKVDQLMSLCDQLKTQLSQARQLNQQLASTLVEQAVA